MVKPAKKAKKSAKGKKVKKATKAARTVKKAAKKAPKPSKNGPAAPAAKTAAAKTPKSPIYISGPNGEEERCEWDAAKNIYVCEFLNEGETAPANAMLVQRASFKNTVQLAAARAPPSPIYVSGPNGELERCDWDAGKNIYVCKFVDEGETAPANAVLVQRAAVVV